MIKGLGKSSKKKQGLFEKFLKNKNTEKEQNKTLFESLKKKSKKNYCSNLIGSYKYNKRKTWDVTKDIIGNKKSPMPLFPTLSR